MNKIAIILAALCLIAACVQAKASGSASSAAAAGGAAASAASAADGHGGSHYPHHHHETHYVNQHIEPKRRRGLFSRLRRNRNPHPQAVNQQQYYPAQPHYYPQPQYGQHY